MVNVSVITALYTASNYISLPIPFLGLQLILDEIIVGMCIIFPILGLIGDVIGGFFVNLTSPMGLIDLISCVVNIPALYCIILF